MQESDDNVVDRLIGAGNYAVYGCIHPARNILVELTIAMLNVIIWPSFIARFSPDFLLGCFIAILCSAIVIASSIAAVENCKRITFRKVEIWSSNNYMSFAPDPPICMKTAWFISILASYPLLCWCIDQLIH